VPPGGRQFLNDLGQMIAWREAMLEDVFEVRDYAAGPTFDLDGLAFTFHPVQHYIMSHAMRVRSPEGSVLVFSSDVGPCPELAEAAREADLFLCESAIFDPSQDEPDPSRRGHLTAFEAAQAARAAAVKRLLITHCRRGQAYDERHLGAARRVFTGPIELASEGQTYALD